MRHSDRKVRGARTRIVKPASDTTQSASSEEREEEGTQPRSARARRGRGAAETTQLYCEGSGEAAGLARANGEESRGVIHSADYKRAAEGGERERAEQERAMEGARTKKTPHKHTHTHTHTHQPHHTRGRRGGWRRRHEKTKGGGLCNTDSAALKEVIGRPPGTATRAPVQARGLQESGR